MQADARARPAMAEVAGALNTMVKVLSVRIGGKEGMGIGLDWIVDCILGVHLYFLSGLHKGLLQYAIGTGGLLQYAGGP